MSNVNSPIHYTQGMKKECIIAMEEMFGTEKLANFCLLNAFKYIWRRKLKNNPTEDAQKANYYLQKYNQLLGTNLSIDNILTCVNLYAINPEPDEHVILDETKAQRDENANQRNLNNEIQKCLHKHNVIACSYCQERDTCPLYHI